MAFPLLQPHHVDRHRLRLGIGYARSGEYLLVNGRGASMDDYDEQRATLMNAHRDAPVRLRYVYPDGVTIAGNTKLYKQRIAATSGYVEIWRNGQWAQVPYTFK